MDYSVAFPSQKLPYKSKGEKWCRGCVDWCSNKSYFNYSPVRKDVVHMKYNYDLINGKVHMEDMAAIINPGNIATSFLPDKVQHYPIINSKINTLRGEEAGRVFDWRVIVTNPYSVSQIEEQKRALFNNIVQAAVENSDIDEAEAERQVSEGKEELEHNWQDAREIQGNELLRHYARELGFKSLFNEGFVDACVVGMEAYQCGIVGGEPTMVRLNPMKLRAFRSGYSNKLEDADIIIYEDYWSPGKIVDTFYDDLSSKDIKWLSDELPDFGGSSPIGSAGNYDEASAFINRKYVLGEDGVIVDNNSELGYIYDGLAELSGGFGSDLLPYDVFGNVRVLQAFWKSRRLILKVKSFDPETGEEKFDFYPETYIPDANAGEVATKLWVNEAWTGTKIGDHIYVRMRPCLVQRNSISNPSLCDFGIIGTIYSLNEYAPYSLVDMMKPYNYLYDAVHAKLVDLIATNWGKLLEMDLALKPKKWEVEKWMYFARANKVLIKDSFNEGDKGASMGKLAGGLNNATKGTIDADWGNSIQNYIEILQWTKDSMSDLVGINRQREGNTYNRETVGGIERAVLQSSYITDWLFMMHDDTKRRALLCFMDYARAALRGRSKKFQYILSDGSMRVMEIDGTEFADSSYGLLVDNSSDTQRLNSKLDEIAQAAAQNGFRLSAIMKLYASASIQEKIRTIEHEEKRSEQAANDAAQQGQQLAQQQIQAQQEMKMQELQQKDLLNQRDNETKIKTAEINAQAEYLRLGIYEEENNEELRREEMQIDNDKLKEEIRQFDKELRFKEKELDTKKELELKKIAAQRASKAKPTNK